MSEQSASGAQERAAPASSARPTATDAVAPAPAAGPDHLVPVPGTGWSLWRTVVVRGAGFPAQTVEELAAPQAASLADALLDARERAAELTEQALARVSAEGRAASAEERKRLKDLWRRVRAAKPVAPGEGADACAAVAATRDLARVEEAYRNAYRMDKDAAGDRLAALSQEPRFREAMLWQSADSTRRICRSLLPGSRPAHRRAALTQMAMRVQRYCAKNDTIGFFGPHGWAFVDDAAARLEMTAGPKLTAFRRVFFEGWSIDTLASGLESEHDLRPWIAPRIKAGVWVQGLQAYRPFRRPLALSAAEAAVLALCDGERGARELARMLLLRPDAAGLAGEQEVFAVLDRLVADDVVAWRLEVAAQIHPELELGERLARIGDPVLRERCVGALDELLRARDRVGTAAGSAEQVDATLAELEQCFTRLTGQSASRRLGQTYAGRTLVFEDCRRDIHVRIGASLLADLAQPLGIVLDGARWAAAEVDSAMRAHLRASFAELGARPGGEVDCHRLFSYVVSATWPKEGRSTVFDGALARFQQRWADVLGSPSESGPGRASFPVEAVRARADGAFKAREAGWTLGRYVSPDLLIAAASVEAIQHGEYHGVIGEVHCGNSMAQSPNVATHPDPRWLFDATAEDTRHETVVIPTYPKSGWLARMNRALVLPQHWRYGFGDDVACHPRCRELPAGMLAVVDTGASLEVQARDGSVRFDVLELFGPALLDEVNHLLAEFRPQRPHLPRLSLGRLTIARERWNVTPAEMPFRHQCDPAQQFLELRAWSRTRGMPRHVFVKPRSERKPWFLDFGSPMYAEIFSTAMRKVPDDTPVAVSEMMPDLQGLWLFDAEGRRFTSELRCVARHVP